MEQFLVLGLCLNLSLIPQTGVASMNVVHNYVAKHLQGTNKQH